MIWQDQQHAADEARQAFTAFVRREVLAVEDPLRERTVMEEAVADSVAAYCEMQFKTFCLPVDLVAWLSARALTSLGQHAEAQAVLERFDLAATMEDAAAFLALPDDAAFLWQITKGGYVRSSRWHGEASGGFWVLDLALLESGEDVSLELRTINALRAMLRRMAGVWDACNGQGCLGVKGMPGHAERLTARRRQHPATKRMIEELLQYCGTTMRALAAERQWSTVPRVIRMELS
jgi:hypothetical protein